MIPSRIFPKINIPPCPSETEFHESSSLLFQTAILSGRVRQHPRHMMLWGIFFRSPENRIARNAPHTPCRCKSVRAVSTAPPPHDAVGHIPPFPRKQNCKECPAYALQVQICPGGFGSTPATRCCGVYSSVPPETELQGMPRIRPAGANLSAVGRLELELVADKPLIVWKMSKGLVEISRPDLCCFT
jgi:hypothetical protein